jgi:uncharacterized protein YcfJ
MNYQQRWLLAVALKQPYPSRFEAGDVAPEATETEATKPSIRDQLSAMAVTLRSAQTLVWIGGTVIAVIGGVIGYAIGRSRSK